LELETTEHRSRSRLTTDAHPTAVFTGCVPLSCVEVRCCELARFGHSRQGRHDKMQIVFGPLCSGEGCPIAINVFEGNTAIRRRSVSQITKFKVSVPWSSCPAA
jgi:hypothetical protein